MSIKVILRFCYILGTLIITSCEKDVYDITIKGVVTDQVTGQRVSGASVYCGVIPGGMRKEGLLGASDSTISGSDGTYKIITRSASSKNGAPLGSKGNGIAVIARKDGYAGSDRKVIPYYDAENSVMNITLYKSTQLKLHIKNDTINNNIDAVILSLLKLNTDTYWVLGCNGRKFDSYSVVNDLYGNLPYVLEVLKPSGASFSPPIAYPLTPKPNIVNEFEVLF